MKPQFSCWPVTTKIYVMMSPHWILYFSSIKWKVLNLWLLVSLLTWTFHKSQYSKKKKNKKTFSVLFKKWDSFIQFSCYSILLHGESALLNIMWINPVFVHHLQERAPEAFSIITQMWSHLNFQWPDTVEVSTAREDSWESLGQRGDQTS